MKNIGNDPAHFLIGTIFLVLSNRNLQASKTLSGLFNQNSRYIYIS